jgi:hypothetical protein
MNMIKQEGKKIIRIRRTKDKGKGRERYGNKRKGLE